MRQQKRIEELEKKLESRFIENFETDGDRDQSS